MRASYCSPLLLSSTLHSPLSFPLYSSHDVTSPAAVLQQLLYWRPVSVSRNFVYYLWLFSWMFSIVLRLSLYPATYSICMGNIPTRHRKLSKTHRRIYKPQVWVITLIFWFPPSSQDVFVEETQKRICENNAEKRKGSTHETDRNISAAQVQMWGGVSLLFGLLSPSC